MSLLGTDRRGPECQTLEEWGRSTVWVPEHPEYARHVSLGPSSLACLVQRSLILLTRPFGGLSLTSICSQTGDLICALRSGYRSRVHPSCPVTNFSSVFRINLLVVPKRRKALLCHPLPGFWLCAACLSLNFSCHHIVLITRLPHKLVQGFTDFSAHSSQLQDI